MDTCPTEIHIRIVQLACAGDDGSTARSIHLVSRHFRDISDPYLYRSIVVSGPVQMNAVADRLESRKNRVHHLLLADVLPVDVQRTESELKEGSFDNRRLGFLRLIPLVAPSLETLVFIIRRPLNGSNIVIVNDLLGQTFPSLIELTLSGFYRYPHVPNSMPRLERLHLHGNGSPYRLLWNGTLRISCPLLTHLRVSSLQSAVPFAREIDAYFRFLCEGVTPQYADIIAFSENNRLPSVLRHFVVQPRTSVSAFQGIVEAMDRDMMRILGSVAARLDGEYSGLPFKFTLLERDEDRRPFYDIARREWLERLNGGAGCWDGMD